MDTQDFVYNLSMNIVMKHSTINDITGGKVVSLENRGGMKTHPTYILQIYSSSSILDSAPLPTTPKGYYFEAPYRIHRLSPHFSSPTAACRCIPRKVTMRPPPWTRTNFNWLVIEAHAAGFLSAQVGLGDIMCHW